MMKNTLASRFILLLAVIFLVGWNPKKTIYDCQKNIDKNSKNLNVMKKKMEAKLDERNGYEVKENKIEIEIDEINKKKKSLSCSIGELSSKIRANTKKEKALAEELRIASLKIADLKIYLNKELERYYIERIISSKRYTPFSLQTYYMISDIQNKISLLHEVHSMKNDKERQSSRLSEVKLTLAELKQQREKEKDEYAKLEDDKLMLQKEVKDKKRLADKEIEGIKSSMSQLEKLLKKLEDEKALVQKSLYQNELVKRKMVNLKGKLSWPVSGPVVSKFGRQRHPKLDTCIINNGIKIESSAQEVVHAVARGDVVFVGDFPGYGRTVIIDHQSGYFSVYSNMGEITVSEKQQVKAFEEIGKLNALADKEILYFEFRIHGEAVDPLVWLEGK